jgi:hypothetical protein
MVRHSAITECAQKVWPSASDKTARAAGHLDPVINRTNAKAFATVTAPKNAETKFTR